MQHILGAGAIGTLWAAHLPVSRAIMLLRRAKVPPILKLQVSRDWVTPCDGEVAGAVKSLVSVERTVTVEPSTADGPIQCLVLATKAADADAALRSVVHRIDHGAPSAVVLLCNGALSLAEELRVPPTTALLAATTTHGAWLHPISCGTRRVHHAGQGSTWIGELPGRPSEPGSLAASASATFVAEFASLGLGAAAEGLGATERRLWLKLAANAIINPLSALGGVQNGEVLASAEGARTAHAVCAELAALAEATLARAMATSRSTAAVRERRSPSSAEMFHFVEAVAAATASNWSSMQRDLECGRPTEIEALNGWAAKMAAGLGVPCDATRGLAEEIRAREARARGCARPSQRA